MRERTRQRLAFDLYVKLGPQRTLERLQQAIQQDPSSFDFKRPLSLRTLYRWSSSLNWQARIAELERQARLRDSENQLQTLVEMNSRQAEQGLLLQHKAMLRLEELKPSSLSAKDVARFLVDGVKMERLARGYVTQRSQIESRTGLDLTGFSVPELRALAELAIARADPPEENALDAPHGGFVEIPDVPDYDKHESHDSAEEQAGG